MLLIVIQEKYFIIVVVINKLSTQQTTTFESDELQQGCNYLNEIKLSLVTTKFLRL